MDESYENEYYNSNFPEHPNSEEYQKMVLTRNIYHLVHVRDKMKEELKEKDWGNTPEEHIIAYEEGHAAAMAWVESEIEKIRSQIWELERQIRESKIDYSSEDSSDEIERKKNEAKQNTWRSKRSKYRPDDWPVARRPYGPEYTLEA
ncbi:MAG: hypothetical protein ACO37V_02180 [Ilumatobacteraceae bacterium]